MSAGLQCWSCGAGLDEVPLPISRHANCPDCYTELHCCRLCKDFDPGLAEQCRDDRTDPPSNKEGANFCEFFRPTVVTASRGTARGDAARAELDTLFGGDSEANTEAGETNELDTDDVSEVSAEDAARAKLDALFKKSED